MIMKNKTLFVLLSLVMLLGACAQHSAISGNAEIANTAEDAELLQPSVVELDVFSGRENPTWTLVDEQTLALGQILAGLQQADQSTARFEGLGYRGFLVQLVAPESRAVSNLYAGSGMVEIESGGEKTVYLDPDHQVEKWLLESGKTYLEAGLYVSMLEEIQ